ncbi:MAG: uroporphyrinogen-III C-methyltransferase [Nitrospirota bacterium]
MGEAGKVILVGAGPGDPGLITLKGKEAIERADVVVYDYLASPRLLSYARPDAEKLYVGKKGGAHTVPQEGINDLIVARAREGKVVVRLKGGDPFVFGRGGEEAEELAEAGIAFEVVPGVTAAVAVPAYAGIPLTHRDFTATAAIVTGHEDPTKAESNIDWDALARIGSLVFFMGVGNLPGIAESLIAHGRSPSTLVAVIQWGTTPRQKTVTGTLETISAEAVRADIKPPALIVVGDVVSLRDKLNWFEVLPLFGRRVVVTRTRTQASALSSRLVSLGADVLECPTIEIAPPDSFALLDKAIERIAAYHVVIFTSVNGVARFFERLWGAGKDARVLEGAKIAAIGPATGEAIEKWGVRPDLTAKVFQAEGVLDVLPREAIRGSRILIPRAAEAREVLPLELRARGATVDVVPAYRTIRPQTGAIEEVRKGLDDGTIDAVTFTSSSTATNFIEMLGEGSPRLKLKGVTVASIGPVTSETVRRLGLPVTVEAAEATIPALVDALVDHYKTKGRSHE